MSTNDHAIQPGGFTLAAGVHPLPAPVSPASPDGSTPDGSQPPAEKVVACPFRVVIDTREQKPYRFAGLRANADQDHAIINVPTVRRGLEVGDYAIDGIEWTTVERKSKEDLYSSVGRRANFEGRLDRMCSLGGVSLVVVECEWESMLMDPPHYSKLHPKALARTLMSWWIRYPVVHWAFMPSRADAEAMTFRFLERYWYAWQAGHTATQQNFAKQIASPAGPPFGSMSEVQP